MTVNEPLEYSFHWRYNQHLTTKCMLQIKKLLSRKLFDGFINYYYVANHPKPSILKNIYFLIHFLYGSGIWGWSNWVVLFWVCHEVEVEMLVVAVVIIWRLDWSWRIFFQMIHSHGCGQETVAPHHLDVFKGLSFPANIASGFPPEWVIQDSKILQRIFLIQGLNPGLPHCRWIPYHLSHQGSPRAR